MSRSLSLDISADVTLPCGPTWECSPIVAQRWDHPPFSAPVSQVEKVRQIASTMNVPLSKAVHAALNGENDGPLPHKLSAAFLRQKAAREFIGIVWCRATELLREPCSVWQNNGAVLKQAPLTWCNHTGTALDRRGRPCNAYNALCKHHLLGGQPPTNGPVGGFCMAERDPRNPLAHYRKASSMAACLNPWVARGLLDLFGSGRVLDVGAGVGAYAMFMSQIAGEAGDYSRFSSLDGAENIEEWSGKRVRFFDVSSRADAQGVVPVDWVMSVEMAEHVPASLEAAVVANLHWLNTQGILLTWALPGQPGSGHINGRSNRYVHSLLHQLGYVRDVEAEARLRGTVNRFRLPAPPEHHSVLAWNCNNTAVDAELSIELSRLRHARRPVSSNVSAAEATQSRMLTSWLNVCPWLGDTLMVYRRKQPRASVSDEGTDVLARAHQLWHERQRKLQELALNASIVFGLQREKLRRLEALISPGPNGSAALHYLGALREGLERHLEDFKTVGRKVENDQPGHAPK